MEWEKKNQSIQKNVKNEEKSNIRINTGQIGKNKKVEINPNI